MTEFKKAIQKKGYYKECPRVKIPKYLQGSEFEDVSRWSEPPASLMRLPNNWAIFVTLFIEPPTQPNEMKFLVQVRRPSGRLLSRGIWGCNDEDEIDRLVNLALHSISQLAGSITPR